MAIGGTFVAGSIISKLIMDTTKWDKSVKGVVSKTGQMGKKIGQFGGMLAKKVTLPLALAGAAAVKASADFEQKLVNAFSVTGSASEEVKQQMSDLAREMGATTVFAATEAADAMYYMASAGWKADDMAAALKDTLDLAAATQTDLAMATEAVISTINQFGLISADAGRVSNVFAAAISNSQATMDRLKTSMRYVGPVMNSLGVSVEETSSILMGLYNAGIDASTAGTALRMGLTKLMVPTKQSSIALANLGLTFEQVNPETHKLADIIQLLGERGATTKDILMLFGQRAGPAFAALISKGGDALKDYEAQITGTNRAAEMAEMQIDTFKGSFKLLTSALTESAISIGDMLAPAIRGIADGITGLISSFNKLGPEAKRVIMVVAGVAAAMGPLALIIGKILILVSKLKVAMAASKAGFILSSGGVMILVAALAALVVVYMKVAKARDEANAAAQRAADQEDILFTKLKKATDAAGMSELQFLKLRDAYKGNAAAMAFAIKKGKEGKELQESLAKVSKEHREEIEKQKTAMDDGIPTVAELTAEFAKLEITEDEAKKAAEEWVTFMKSIGITTIQEKADRVKDLQGKLAKLNALYKAGAIDMKSYVDGTNKVNKEITELSTTLTTTALPAARFTAGEIANVYSNAVGEMETRTGDFTKVVKTKAVEIIDIGKEFSMTFAASFNESVVGMLDKTMTLKDGVLNILGSLKSTAIQIFADMATGYVMGFAKKLIVGTLEATTSVTSQLTSTAKNIIGKVGEWSPGGIVGSAISGAVSGLFSGIFGGGGMSKSTEEHLRLIHQNTTNINDVLRIDMRDGQFNRMLGHLEESQKHLFAIQARADRRNQLLTKMEGYEKLTAKATEGMANQLKNLSGARVGATFTGTELAVMHGTPATPEIAAPISMIGNVVGQSTGMIIAAMKKELDAMKKDPSTDPAKIAAFEKYMAERIKNLTITEQQKSIESRERSKVEMQTDMNIHIEVRDQIDPHAAQRITRETIIPQMLRALEINEGTNRTKLEEVLKLRI